MSDYFRVTTKEEVLELLASLPEFLDENGFSEEEKQKCIANYTRLAERCPTEKELLESEWYADMMDYIDQVLAREERLRANFEAKIYADCDFCKEPILYGEEYFYDGYDRMCEKCMDKFETRRA